MSTSALRKRFSSRKPFTKIRSSKRQIIVEKASARNGGVGQKYWKSKLLGNGGFASVYLVEEVDSNEKYALKIIPKTTLKKPSQQRKLKQEIRIHRSCRHPNICEFIRSFEDSDNVYILLEYCPCQTALELVESRRRLSEPEARYLMWQVIIAVKYLHEDCLVIHRDLKLGNLFLDSTPSVKIGDFGLCAKLDFDGQKKSTICGTPNYIAPEIITTRKNPRGVRGRENREPAGHSFEVDVWALGVILYTFLVGRPPFETRSVTTTYRAIREVQYTFPPQIPVSCDAKDLIQSLLKKDPTERLQLEEIMEHAFFVDSFRTDGTDFRSKPPLLLQHYSRRFMTKANLRIDTSVSKRKNNTKKKGSAQSGKKRTKGNLVSTNTTPPRPKKKRIAFGALRNEGNENRRRVVKKQPVKKKSLKKLGGKSNRQKMVDTGSTKNRRPVTSSGRKKSHKLAAPTSCVLLSEEEKKKIPDIVINREPSLEEVVEDAKQPDQLIVMFEDYSSKYGYAYLFSNGIVGTYFNDGTIMMLNESTGCYRYYTRTRNNNNASNKKKDKDKDKENLTFYRKREWYFNVHQQDQEQYPKEFRKKFILVNYFLSLFKRRVKKMSHFYWCPPPRVDDDNVDVFVKHIFKTKQAVVFRYNNRHIQVIFNDSSEIMLSNDAKVITYKEGIDYSNRSPKSLMPKERKTFSLEYFLKRPDNEIKKRLKYVRSILNQLVQ